MPELVDAPTSPQPVQNAGDLGRAVREARRRAKLSQREVADHLGFPRSYLSDLERGAETLHLRRLLDTLAALGLDLQVVPRWPL